jgi:hypothetical protein
MERAPGAETSHPQSRQSRALAEQVSPATTYVSKGRSYANGERPGGQ